MKTVHVREAEFAVLDEGDGPPVLFVHGFPLDHSMWRGQTAFFSRTHRVVAPDLRGFGRSGGTRDVVEMSDLADDLAGLLDELDVTEPVVYCGLSMGGYVAWPFVERHADRLRALIVCDSRAAADTDEGRANRAKMAKSVLANGPEAAVEAMIPKLFADRTRSTQPSVVNGLRKVMLASEPRAIAAALGGMANRPDSTSLLPDIDVPTLYLCGEHDEITPPDEMAAMAEATPNATFVQIDGMGHMTPLEDPAATNAAIRSFLADLD